MLVEKCSLHTSGQAVTVSTSRHAFVSVGRCHRLTKYETMCVLYAKCNACDAHLPLKFASALHHASSPVRWGLHLKLLLRLRLRHGGRIGRRAGLAGKLRVA